MHQGWGQGRLTVICDTCTNPSVTDPMSTKAPYARTDTCNNNSSVRLLPAVYALQSFEVDPEEAAWQHYAMVEICDEA